MKRRFNEAESYGWVVEDWEASEAYDLACEYMGKDYVDDAIINCISSEELAACLAYLFRMWDFREWDNRNGEDDEFEESVRRSIKEARREMSPQYDSRKSFYGKAHVVDDEDGTLTLYSYNTPVCEIKDGKVRLLAMWDSSQTTLRHVKEFLKQNGFEVGSKQSIAKMYGESLRRKNRKFRK
jgi:hypothetical protein